MSLRTDKAPLAIICGKALPAAFKTLARLKGEVLVFEANMDTVTEWLR